MVLTRLVRHFRPLVFLHHAVLAMCFVVGGFCAVLWLITSAGCVARYATRSHSGYHSPIGYFWDPQWEASWTDFKITGFGVIDCVGLGIQIPFWIPTLFVTAYLLAVFGPRYLRRRRRKLRVASGQCLACGYDLRGNTSGACSECGTAIGERAAEPSDGPALIGAAGWRCAARWAVGLGVLAFVLLAILNTEWVSSLKQEVDINTGRLRTTRCFLGKTDVRVEDSPLTQALAEEDLRDVQPDWHTVTRFCPSFDRASRRYRYFGAAAQTRALTELWAFASFSPAAKRAVARQILDLWRKTGNYSTVPAYMFNLFDFALHVGKAGSIDAGDVPTTWPAWEVNPWTYADQ